MISSSGHKQLISTLRKLVTVPGVDPSLVLVVVAEWSEVSVAGITGVCSY